MLCWAFFHSIAHRVSSPSWGNNRVGCHNSKPCWLLRPKINGSHCTHSTLILPYQSRFYSFFQLSHWIEEYTWPRIYVWFQIHHITHQFLYSWIHFYCHFLLSWWLFQTHCEFSWWKFWRLQKHHSYQQESVSCEIIHYHKSIFVPINTSVCCWPKQIHVQ